jgi:transketolase
MSSDLEELCINTMRFLAIDAVEKAGSGHPGAPMGAATMAYVLWQHYLKHNPSIRNGSTATASCCLPDMPP